MLKTSFLCFTLFLFVTSSVSAELRFTMRTETRKTKSSEPPDPFFTKFGEMFATAVAPGGRAETVFIVGDERVRVELGAAIGGLPAGTVILRQADGSTFILNPTDRTYRKTTLETRTNGLAAADVSSKRTGEFATIAGVRAERVTLAATFDFSKAPQPAPGFPTKVTLDWQLWVADRFKMPPSMMAVMNPAIQLLGLQKYIQDGLVMRQILRSPLLGGYELESRIVEFSERPVPPQLFEVPGDYTLRSSQ